VLNHHLVLTAQVGSDIVMAHRHGLMVLADSDTAMVHLHALMVLAALGTVNKRSIKGQLYGLITNKPS